jgi:ankyrin repeat protein
LVQSLLEATCLTDLHLKDMVDFATLKHDWGLLTTFVKSGRLNSSCLLSVLAFAAKKRIYTLCDLILGQGEVDLNVDATANPLVLACCSGIFETIKYFVDHGAKVDMIVNDLVTPLLFYVHLNSACSKFDPEIVDYLLDNGTNLHVIFKDGGSYLHHIAELGSAKCYKRFLDLGIDSTLRNLGNWTAIGIFLKSVDNPAVVAVYSRLRQSEMLERELEIVNAFIEN